MEYLEQPSDTPIATHIAVIYIIFIHPCLNDFLPVCFNSNLFLLPSETLRQPPEVTQPPVVPPSSVHPMYSPIHHVHTDAGVFTLRFLLFYKNVVTIAVSHACKCVCLLTRTYLYNVYTYIYISCIQQSSK